MDNIRLFEIDDKYIDYLLPAAPHLFRNKKPEQHNDRKYIGVIFTVNGFEYFAPLSSYKDKHRFMRESLDFLKIKHYAVINLNNMFPVPSGVSRYVEISKENNPKYRALLLAEYRYIKSIQEKYGRMQSLFTTTKSRMVTQQLWPRDVMTSICSKKPVKDIRHINVLFWSNSQLEMICMKTVERNLKEKKFWKEVEYVENPVFSCNEKNSEVPDVGKNRLFSLSWSEIQCADFMRCYLFH